MEGIETPPLASETIAHIGSFEVRNTLIMAWLAMAVIVVIAVLARRTRYREIPGRFQALLELIVEGLFDFFDSVIGDRKQTRTFFPTGWASCPASGVSHWRACTMATWSRCRSSDP